MSEIIGDAGCPDCIANGRDKTLNHLILFDDGHAYCNRCGYREGKDTYTKPKVKFNNNKTEEELIAETNEVPQYTTTSHYPERKLKKLAFKHFGIRNTVSQVDGETRTGTFIPIYGKANNLQGWKIIYPNKKFNSVGNTKGEVQLLGQHVAPKSGMKLFITEGQWDMVSLYQILYEHTKPEWRDKIAVVSIKNGAASAYKELSNNQKFLDGYQEWVLCFDDDTKGREAVLKCVKYLDADKITSATFGVKDANDVLIQGNSTREAFFAAIKAKKPKALDVVRVEDVWEAAKVKPVMGLSFPWPSLTKLTYGIRRATTYCIGAAPKIGKTDFEYQLISHIIQVHGISVAHYDFESHPAKSAKRLAGKFMGKVFHNPNVEYKDEELEEGLGHLKGKWEAYKHDGSRDWDAVKATIKRQAADGIWIFILDPLTAFISQLTSSEANDKLNEIQTDIANMNVSLGITFFIFSHVNPPKTGKPHEDGGRVLSSQFTGSRAMEKWTHYGIGIERDRNNEDDQVRNTSTHRLLYDRDFGECGHYEAFYERDTGLYKEKEYEQGY